MPLPCAGRNTHQTLRRANSTQISHLLTYQAESSQCRPQWLQIKKKKKKKGDPTPQQGQVVRLPTEIGDLQTPIQLSYGYSPNGI